MEILLVQLREDGKKWGERLTVRRRRESTRFLYGSGHQLLKLVLINNYGWGDTLSKRFTGVVPGIQKSVHVTQLKSFSGVGGSIRGFNSAMAGVLATGCYILSEQTGGVGGGVEEGKDEKGEISEGGGGRGRGEEYRRKYKEKEE